MSSWRSPLVDPFDTAQLTVGLAETERKKAWLELERQKATRTAAQLTARAGGSADDLRLVLDVLGLLPDSAHYVPPDWSWVPAEARASTSAVCRKGHRRTRESTRFRRRYGVLTAVCLLCSPRAKCDRVPGDSD